MNREISNEIAAAIRDIAAGADEARLRASPTIPEIERVIARAWAMADAKEPALHWNGGTFWRAVVPGMRVVLVKPVDNYPDCYIEAGETGVLTHVDCDGGYWIRLDADHPELAEWANEIQIWDWSGYDPALHPDTYLAALQPRSAAG